MILADVARAKGDLSGRDPVLEGIFNACGELTWSTDTDYFAALVRKIVAQQLSAAAARTVHSRVVAHLGGVIAVDSVLAAAPEGLRACGLSWPKVKYVIGLAERVADGRLDVTRLADLDDEAAIAILVQVPGLGRWSAEMFLMFTLGRPDVFSTGDLALKLAMVNAYGKPVETFAKWGPEVAETWRPWRTVACRYLYAWLDGERARLKAQRTTTAQS